MLKGFQSNEDLPALPHWTKSLIGCSKENQRLIFSCDTTRQKAQFCDNAQVFFGCVPPRGRRLGKVGGMLSCMRSIHEAQLGYRFHPLWPLFCSHHWAALAIF